MECYGYLQMLWLQHPATTGPANERAGAINSICFSPVPTNKTAPHPRRPRCGYVYKASPPFRIRHRFGGTPADGVGQRPGRGGELVVGALVVFIGRRYGGARPRFGAGFNAWPGGGVNP